MSKRVINYESLTKENFFDEMNNKYPFGLAQFLKWLDKYKKEIGWENVFNGIKTMNQGVGFEKESCKFHELPIAMQMGIYFQFMRERGGCSMELDIFDYDFRRDFECMLSMLEGEKSLEELPFPTISKEDTQQIANEIDAGVLEKLIELGDKPTKFLNMDLSQHTNDDKFMMIDSENSMDQGQIDAQETFEKGINADLRAIL